MRTPYGYRIHIGNYHKFKRDPSEQIRYAERIIAYGIPSEKVRSLFFLSVLRNLSENVNYNQKKLCRLLTCIKFLTKKINSFQISGKTCNKQS